ncbi:Gluconolactonase precursor [Symmachiella dynata]|uniref:SMP-30/gluconolactonase/LRE family protein n=1 Tax=Symmachiella dynata TaxID=2527995 RepID=UPI00118865F8|nr:SMP-30/gluconolactonase/LRE family protein [Symmachiella dynata]QDT49118.1 Gluconolactonase precursor [Symmachiella dynata]
MKRIFTFLMVLSVGGLVLTSAVAAAEENYDIDPDSLPQKGVPQGEIKGPFPWKSEIFPGTEREYWIYVPAQYDKDKPACVMVVQDGLGRAKGWKMPTVFDNLIHKGEMPVTIGIFITPGVVPAPHEGAQARFNRSFEYDSLGDRYANFLIEEILPEVSKSYNLSEDPNDRAISGASSGAICAFNVAWERPDQFRRVFSTIGTFVGLRGANEFPVLVRKVEPKPIRVFLQDGSNDLDLYGGSWWVANQDMLASLAWAGYDVNHAWGQGGHNGKQGAAILPDAMRWLWRDYPEPIRVGTGGGKRRTDILIPGEDWQLVSKGHKFTEGPAVNDKGEVFFTDVPNSQIYKIGLDGMVSLFAEETGNANGLMFGKDGKLYACVSGKKQIVAYSPDGKSEVIAENVSCNDLVIGDNGIYVTDPENKRVLHIGWDKKVSVVDDKGLEFPNGVVLSPDQSLLYVADTRRQYVNSYQVQPDGTLRYKQPFHHLHIAPTQTDTGADGMTVDDQGRLYVATRMGVQVCDQPGRVHLILSKPQGSWLSNVVFGGKDLNTLYVTCGGSIYKRKMNAKGLSVGNLLKPPKPRL